MRPLDATAQPTLLHLILLLAALLLSPACTGVLEDNGSADDSEFALTTTQRKARYEAIKNASYHAGLSRPVLLAGIAQAGAAEPGQMGFFGTVSGSFLVTGKDS